MSNLTNHPLMGEDFAAQSRKTAEIMRHFNEAFLQHEPGGLTALVAEDCIIEGVAPAPNVHDTRAARHASSSGKESQRSRERISTLKMYSWPGTEPP